MIHEKEFAYNLWLALNPSNTNHLDDALVYDVLLLLIYNVSAPISVTAKCVNEYLDNLYR